MGRYVIGFKTFESDEWIETETDNFFAAVYRFAWAVWRYPFVDIAYRDVV